MSECDVIPDICLLRRAQRIRSTKVPVLHNKVIDDLYLRRTDVVASARFDLCQAFLLQTTGSVDVKHLLTQIANAAVYDLLTCRISLNRLGWLKDLETC